MANIRFIHDFASDSATLTASTTAGSLAPANMQRNEKAAVWRSTATTATITAIWPTLSKSIRSPSADELDFRRDDHDSPLHSRRRC